MPNNSGMYQDHTSTMLEKKHLLEYGIMLPREIRYVPQHRRTARGIVAGIVGGTIIWIFVLITLWLLWRILTK